MVKGNRFHKKGFRIFLSTILLLGALVADWSLGHTDVVNAASSLSDGDFLKTNGTSIRKSKGTGSNVYLRGTNAGGWLVQESWMNPTNAPDQKTMMNTFKDRFGAAARDELISVYEDHYWTTQDFDNISAMGMTVVRLPFTYMNLVDDSGNLKADAWARLDWFVENSRQRGIYVILDMHGAFGSQNGMDHSGEINDGNQLYGNPNNRQKTLWLWEKIAEHFKGNPAIAAYDILNEPGIKAAATGRTQWDFYNEIYNRIRAVDGDHIIMMESCWDAANLPHPQEYGWTNVVYEYHYYPWDSVTSAPGQAAYISSKVADIRSHNYGVPTFVGEFTSFDVEDAWKNTLSTFNREGWHWTTWTYKVTGSNNSWGIYNLNAEAVDIYRDSQETIRQKWSKVGANYSAVNSKIYNVIKPYLQGSTDPGSGGSSLFADGEYYLTSVANGGVVSAENGGAEPLAANRASVGGAWETLRLENNSDGTFSFKSMANQKYVCAVIDESNQLLARSASIGTWEKFELVSTGNGDYGIKALANGKFVQANLNSGGRLEATQDKVAGAWEAFKITKMGDSSGLDFDSSLTDKSAEFYEHVSYQGKSIKLSKGEYTYNDLVSKGIGNDTISSLKVPQGYKVTLYADDLYKGGAKVLLADAPSLGDFNDKTSSIKVEQVTLGNFDEGGYTLTAIVNKKVVSAENGGKDPLVADRNSNGGAWETFKLVNNGDGTVSFQSMANNKYVCAVVDEKNQLLARSSSIGTWEKFYLEKIKDYEYAIYAVANGKYIKADQQNGGKLFASSDTIGGAWEAFWVTGVN